MSRTKKSFIVLSVIVLIIIIVIPHIMGIFNLMLDYKLKIPTDAEFLTLKNYINFFNFKNKINNLVLAAVVFLILFLVFDILTKKNKDEYERVEAYGSHGTSRFQNKKEIEIYKRDKKGWFLGSTKKEDYSINMNGVYHPVENELNMQTIVVGPPGSKKTTAFILNNIFNTCYQYKEDGKDRADMVIIDPKSEIYQLTAEYLKNNSYDVHVLDFIHFKFGDSLNPLDYIENDMYLREVCRGFINAMSSSYSNSGDADFWNNQEYQLMAAITGFVLQKSKKKTFTEVAKILKSDNVFSVVKSKYFFKENNIKGAALDLWNSFLMYSDSEKTRSCILGGLAEKLNLFSLNGVKRITQRTTVPIEMIGRKKEKPIALFMFMPDANNTFGALINVFVSTIFNQIYKRDYNSSDLNCPTYFFLEEMANIGTIPNIQERLGTMRSRKIFPIMVWQSLSQMKDRYRGWEDIISQCDTQVYLGINDDFTAKICSESLGKTTVRVRGLSKGNESVLNVSNQRESENYQQRLLLMPDECRRIDNNKMIIIQRTKFPMIIYKSQYKYWEKPICGKSHLEDLIELKDVKKKLKIKTLKNTKFKGINKTMSSDSWEKENPFDKIDFRQLLEE